MADNKIFNNELLLCQDHKMTDKIIVPSDHYRIDKTDPHLINLYHGKLFDIIGQEETSRKVSFLTFQCTQTASTMRRRLDSLSALAPLNVARTCCVSPLKALIYQPFTSIGSKQMDIPSMQEIDIPCLLIEQVSTLTFDVWHQTSSEENLTSFFRSLFSAVGMFHQDGKYFGNIRAGIRISANRPIFVFPAVFKATECDQGIRNDLRALHEMVLDSKGIRNDLRSLHEMVLDSKIPGIYEMKLFDELCTEYVEYNGNFKYNGKSLRDGSFLITHCPVVWTATDRYDFIRKLGEYRDQNKQFYDQLTSDASEKAIPIDFWTRIERAKPFTLASKLKSLYYYDNCKGNGNKTSYTSTESIRRFHRCGYEHKLGECPLWLQMEKVLYSVFPEAPASLYKMMIDRLYLKSDRCLHPIINFLQDGPHKFSF